MIRPVVATLLTLLFCGSTLPAQGLPGRALDLMRSGGYSEALQQLQAERTDDPFRLRLLIELHLRTGDSDRARGYAATLLQLYRAGLLDGPAQLGQAAFAAWQTDLWEEANQIFIDASQAPQVPLSLFVDWGRLYLEKYNAAEAETIFRDALAAKDRKQDFPRWTEADAYAGLAHALQEQSNPQATEYLTRALELDPANATALELRALLALQSENESEAADAIRKGLERNPNSLELLQLESAVHYFREEKADFEAAEQRILSINPRPDRLYELLGDLSVSKRNLDDAVKFYRRACDLNPRQWSALSSLGINLLRLGDEQEGRQALEKAYANDPYNIWTVNTLRLVDSFANFERIETSRFSIKLHRKEAAILQPYVTDLLDRSLATLEGKYAHKVDRKVVFEMYPDHEDFAVRTLGLPGLGALGATFGSVVAMDSPSARPKGEFHWGSTLWHEMAHVVTLSLSANRVPRWLTEGLSMMEERLGGKGWGDGLSPAFAEAWKTGKLLSLGELNSGFVRPSYPGQLQISYFQAGWVCEFIARRYGFEKLRAMLAAYAGGSTTEKVFRDVLGEDVDQIDEHFREEVRETLEPLSEILERPERPGQTEEALLAALSSSPNNYALNVAFGHWLVENKRPGEAVPYLKKAIDLFPDSAGKGSPYDWLARAYAALDEKEELVAVLSAWWQKSPLRVETALQLATLLDAGERPSEARDVLQEAMFANPFERSLHLRLGQILLRLDRPEEAADEFSVLLALEPVNVAEAHYHLAEALFQAGKAREARLEVLRSLEIAPAYVDAQKLLLKIARAK